MIAPEPLGKKSSCAVLPRYQSTSYRKRHHFSQLFLCLSRACLGKMMIFNTRIEWRNKEGVFRTSSESPHAWRAILISSSSGGQPCDRQHALTQLIVLSGECVSQLVDSFIGGGSHRCEPMGAVRIACAPHDTLLPEAANRQLHTFFHIRIRIGLVRTVVHLRQPSCF